MRTRTTGIAALLLSLFASLLPPSAAPLYAGGIRASAVAGQFYPESRETLSETVRSLLDGAPSSGKNARPGALIAPHAGYLYSGSTAPGSSTSRSEPVIPSAVSVPLPCSWRSCPAKGFGKEDSFTIPLPAPSPETSRIP